MPHFTTPSPAPRRNPLARAAMAALATVSTLTALATLGALSGTAQAATTYVNGLALPASGLDQSGGTSANNGRLGYFSDIYYDPNARQWWGLSDRGPGGGTLDYTTRAQRFTVDVDAATGAISNFRVLETVLFSAGGSPMNGLAPSPVGTLGNALDPEGFVVIPGSGPSAGLFAVSDEYGPTLALFDRSGALVRRFTTPANLLPRNAASGALNFAGDAGNTAGKRTNRGFEGLAVSPDGQYLYAMLQSAMLDEGGGDGVYNRIVKFDIATGTAVAQYAYRMKRSGQGQGISALVAVNDHEFFVLERNNRGIGVGATLATADKEVYRIDIAGATDVSSIDLDAAGAVFTPVAKSAAVLDLDANTLAALGNRSPEKWEGLAIGPQLANGNWLLLAGTDNDYSVTQNGTGTQFDVYFRFSDADPYASSIQCPLGETVGCTSTATGLAMALTGDHSMLPGVLAAYQIDSTSLGAYVVPTASSAVPEPAGWALLGLAAFAAFGVRGRKAR